jgi:hypothetical protein
MKKIMFKKNQTTLSNYSQWFFQPVLKTIISNLNNYMSNNLSNISDEEYKALSIIRNDLEDYYLKFYKSKNEKYNELIKKFTK